MHLEGARVRDVEPGLGCQFIQDAVQYSSRTPHTNLDLYDRIVPAGMMKNAVITAAFVLQTAHRDEMLPRKALPKPQPSARRRSRGVRRPGGGVAGSP